ncbi:hypothetical protein AALA52_03565 [Lactococcus ileimucosae]|uniref:Transposase n=1 Tax=Lactococcus ileimucosae TaxID=2941329 RepID=A0ABV4D191_9LACT
MDEKEKLKIENHKLKDEIALLKGALVITREHLENVIARRALDK